MIVSILSFTVLRKIEYKFAKIQQESFEPDKQFLKFTEKTVFNSFDKQFKNYMKFP